MDFLKKAYAVSGDLLNSLDNYLSNRQYKAFISKKKLILLVKTGVTQGSIIGRWSKYSLSIV